MRKLSTNDLRVLLEDAIVEVVEDAVFNKKMTRSRSRLVYDNLAHWADLGGLSLVRREYKKLHPYKAQLLKDQIQARRANGVNKPINIPGPKPGEKVEVSKPKGNMSTKLISLLLNRNAH